MNFKEALNNISTFIFDLDGVISDDKFYFFDERPIKSFNLKDGYALQLALKKGYRICIISGSHSEAMKERLEILGISHLYFRQHDKLKCYTDFVSTEKISDEEIVYMGDDLPDYEVMKRVAVPTCPNDAAYEIRSICKYVSPKNGGEGCVRDIIEQVMRCQGTWEIGGW